MAVTDVKMAKGGYATLKCLRLALGASATSQTGKKAAGITPGFPFQVVKVEVDALTVTPAASVDVQIGTTSVLAGAITPVAATPTAGTLSTTLANLKGTATSVLSALYTTDGSGAFTNCHVSIWIRPRPLNGEVY